MSFGRRLDLCGSTKVAVAVACKYGNELGIARAWEIWTVSQLLASQKGLWPVELRIYTNVEDYTYFWNRLHLSTDIL